MTSPVVLSGMILLNGPLVVALGVPAAVRARRRPTPVLRSLTAVLIGVCAVLFLGAVQRLGLQFVRAGWAGPEVEALLMRQWNYAQAVLASAVGVWGVYMTTDVVRAILRAEQVVSALAENVPEHVTVSELGLTGREREVLEVIVQGRLSDRESADALYISPATAATHVKSILRKAGLRNRRELLLLEALDAVDPRGER